MGRAEIISNHLDKWQKLYPNRDLVPASVIQQCIWVSRIVTRRLTVMTKSHGFANRGDYEMLLTIFHAMPETMSPVEIAEELHISTSGATGRIDRLEAMGYLVRQADVRDRRSIRIVLTPSGEESLKAVFLDALEIQTEILMNFSSENADMLDHLLASLLGRIDP
jgi:DNA-binding MarR family transcriptional regulator